MLPDYPELKRELLADLNLQVQLVVNQTAPLAGGIRNSLQIEGDKFTYETTEGKCVTKKFLELSAKVEVPSGLSSPDTHEQFTDKVLEAAKNIAHQSEGILFST